MRKRNGSNFVRALVAALLAALLASAWAQDIDPRGLALLEGLQGGDVPDQIRTMDMSMSSITYMDGEEFESSSRTVVDYENQRAAIISQIMGMETRMMLVDGQMKMNVMGMSFPVPAEAADEFDSIFDQPTASSILDGAKRIAFDGPVNYGDLLVGDQVTYEGDAGMYGTPDSPVMHYVFDASGALLGVHLPTDGEEMIMVYREPVRDSMMNFNMNVYRLVGSTWELLQEATLESLEYNITLDEDLFK